MQTIVNLDVPERNVTFLKISRAKYIKDFEGTSLSFRKKQGKQLQTITETNQKVYKQLT